MTRCGGGFVGGGGGVVGVGDGDVVGVGDGVGVGEALGVDDGVGVGEGDGVGTQALRPATTSRAVIAHAVRFMRRSWDRVRAPRRGERPSAVRAQTTQRAAEPSV